MKTYSIVFILLFSFQVFGKSSDPIPPPPMPEYMKKNKEQFVAPPQDQIQEDEEDLSEREIQSIDEDKAEEIKKEFLMSGEELENPTSQTKDTVVEEPLVASEPEPLDDEPAPQFEEVSKKEVIKEVSEEEISTPEFEQADMEGSIHENITENHFKDADYKVEEPQEVPEEILAEVEENLEEAEQVAEQNFDSHRAPSNNSPFKAGMYKFTKKCKMYEEASSMSSNVGNVNVGRKLWVDAHDVDWHKVYKKDGAVYISADCLK